MSAERRAHHLFDEDFDPLADERVRDRVRPGLLAVAVALALVVAVGGFALALSGGRALPASAGTSGLRLSADQQHGRALFARTCATCHTLSAANAVGKVGPDLDVLAPWGLPEAFVADTIAAGMVRGNGTMPSGLLDGDDAAAVASFVSAVTRDRAGAR